MAFDRLLANIAARDPSSYEPRWVVQVRQRWIEILRRCRGGVDAAVEQACGDLPRASEIVCKHIKVLGLARGEELLDSLH